MGLFLPHYSLLNHIRNLHVLFLFLGCFLFTSLPYSVCTLFQKKIRHAQCYLYTYNLLIMFIIILYSWQGLCRHDRYRLSCIKQIPSKISNIHQMETFKSIIKSENVVTAILTKLIMTSLICIHSDRLMPNWTHLGDSLTSNTSNSAYKRC
jgi:hypothetical protein